MAIRFFVCAIGLILFSASHATTWGTTKVKDPIGGGYCVVDEPASSGSYIYDWPSKYDGVYWPFIDHHWIWQCTESGYLSFGNDFEDLNADEIHRIKVYLRKPSSRSGSDLERLEAIYKIRDKDDRFWAWFYRVKAAILTGQADQARYEALPLLEKTAEGLDPGFELIQLYFVIGDYHRRLGQIDIAKEYFSKARTVEWKDKDGDTNVGSEYINALIDERSALFPGRK
jgi:tetratricopeptide (TPR) repeat protein